MGELGTFSATVRTNRYSMSVRLIRQSVPELLHASELVVFEEAPRSPGTNGYWPRPATTSNWTTTWER